jgi:cell division protease FtsH
LLQANRDVLERCARELLARETLDENGIRAPTGDLRRWTPTA